MAWVNLGRFGSGFGPTQTSFEPDLAQPKYAPNFKAVDARVQLRQAVLLNPNPI